MTTTTRTDPRLGLSVPVLVGLALLAVPRAVLHDARVEMHPAVLALLTFGPPAVWIVVALVRRVPSPLATILVVGAFYGVALALVHNLMWESAFGGDEPTLGGALDGELSAGTEEAVLRVATAVSSVFTGAMVGVVAGAVATVLRKVGIARR